MSKQLSGGLHDVIVTRLYSAVRSNSSHHELRADELLIVLERGVNDIPASDLTRLMNQLEQVRLQAKTQKVKARLAKIIAGLQQRHDDEVR